MKEEKSKFVFSISVLLLLIIYGTFSVIYIINGYRSRNVLENRSINWAELYPLDDDNHPSDGSDTQAAGSIFDKYESLPFVNLAERISASDTYRNDLLLGIGAYASSLVSDYSIRNSKVRLTNGYWVQMRSKDDMNGIVDSYIELSAKADALNIPFIYIQTPYKEALTPQNMPWGINNSKNSNIDVFLNKLRSKGINCLDLRNIADTSDNPYSYFYKTDHHWNTALALKASGIISEELKTYYGIDMDTSLMNTVNYKPVTYRQAMFGGAAKEVGHLNEAPEDFTILYPVFDTDFRYINPSKAVDCTGSFADVMIDYTLLDDAISNGGDEVNEVMNYGNCPLVEITNLNYKKGPRILLIKDSYGSTLAPYFALSCGELDLIDPRPYAGNFNGSILNYICKNKPDIILIMQYYPEALPS
ncbi:MAG TPA: hypothetical protein DIS78_03025 [Lachnospiraceae bacterium]|nr:hypothetical protein [Lachnospiraceae bacterium]